MEPEISSAVPIEDGLDESLLGLLPEEIRVDALMRLLPSKDRQSLRFTCRQLRREIDNNLGGSDTIHLHDRKSIAVLAFYSRSAFPEAIVTKTFSRNWIFYSPKKIRTLKFEGIISAKFAISLLRKCTILKSFDWNGAIRGILQVPTLIKLGGLTKLDIGFTFREYNDFGPDVGFTSSDLEKPDKAWKSVGLAIRIHGRGGDWNPRKLIAWWNQLTILKYLDCSHAKTVDLNLWSWSKKPTEVIDELQLATDLLKFLARLTHCKTLKICHKKMYCYGQGRGPNIGHPLNPHLRALSGNLPRLGKPIVRSPVGTWHFKEVMYVSNGYFCSRGEVNLDTFMLTFITSLKSLEVLKLKLRWKNPIRWGNVSTIVANNYKALTHLEIVNIEPANDPVDFSAFEACHSIKVIKISLNSKYHEQAINRLHLEPRHRIINFGPHPSFINSLETLILRNVTIPSVALERIHLLKKLKYLAIYDWNPSDPGCFTHEGISSILRSRSLEGLLLRPHRINNYSSVPERRLLLKTRMTFREIIRCNDYDLTAINISGPDNPWWIHDDQTGEKIVDAFKDYLQTFPHFQ